MQNGIPSSAVELIGKAIKLNEGVAEYHYNIALAWRGLDRSDQVAAHLEQAIKLRPDHALAHLNLGNVHHEQGRLADALACYEQAAALAPSLASANFNIGNVQLQLNRWPEAIAAYRKVLAAAPNHAEAHHRLGIALMALHMHDDAAAHFSAAIALKTQLPGAYENLAAAYFAAGKLDGALQAVVRAVELNDTPQARELFVQCAKSVRLTADNRELRGLLLRALAEGWCRPRELAEVCASLIKLNPIVSECIARAKAAWPARLNATESYYASAIAALAGDPLAICLLKTSALADVGLERLMTNIRHTMLAMSFEGDDANERDLEFFAAVAQQCFTNDYVYALSHDEEESARGLQARLAQALEVEKPIAPLWPIAVAAYFPLHTQHSATALLQRSWPTCVRDVLVQQIEEPAQERRLAAAMPALSAIEENVSRAVRTQYEDNPYPRWVKPGPPALPVILRNNPTLPREILIAGCGTGLSTIELARRMPHARVLALDLSLTSLSFAKRMAEGLGIGNIEFAQADMLRLGSIGRDFDYIESSGVLHHLADPLAGWTVLLSLLRPGGIMQVGLYSALARQNVVAGRALIKERGFPPTPEGIRHCRETIMAADDPLLSSLTQWGDFFTLSECRDLLFHVQEHLFTLPQIKTILTANNLEFAGFVPEPSMLRLFTARYPAPSALLDLDCWHRIESENPNLFANMYQFWIRKPPAPARAGPGGLT